MPIATKSSKIDISKEIITQKIAEKIASKVSKNTTLLFYGNIGVGKTTFIRYLINYLQTKNGLERTEIPSPTFNIINEYEINSLIVRHFDLYRIKDKKELNKNNQNIPFPGWDALEDERREEKVKIWFYIKDKDGNVVRKITGSNKKGMNRVAWDLRHANPRPVRPSSRSSAQGGRRGWNSSGPLVTPGSYSVDLYKEDDQLLLGNGYDHCWVLNDFDGSVRKIASAYSDQSGIQMDVYTDQPGVQLYTGNFLNGSISSKQGLKYEKRSGFCLETQHFPNSPNKESFPNVYSVSYTHLTLPTKRIV